MMNKINETVEYLKKATNFIPEVGIILGSGLGNLTDEITIEHSISYQDIPNFPVSTVKGHSGKLVFGTLSGKKVIAVKGRFHYYEGWSMEQVVFPVRVMKFLGIETLIVSNAAGGMGEKFRVGDLMIINDHINFQPEHPLRGKNNDDLGPRFPDMTNAYDPSLVAKAQDIADNNDIVCYQGVYIGVQGPTFETPAEYKMFHIMGADAVGMSTVPEVIVARHMGIKVFGMSVITDVGYPPEAMEDVSHDLVLAAASNAEPAMTLIIKELLK